MNYCTEMKFIYSYIYSPAIQPMFDVLRENKGKHLDSACLDILGSLDIVWHNKDSNLDLTVLAGYIQISHFVEFYILI